MRGLRRALLVPCVCLWLLVSTACEYDSIHSVDAAPQRMRDGDAGLDATVGPQAEPGIAVVGERCAVEQQRACAGHASKLALVCRNRVWELDSVCRSSERCDSAATDALGTCRPIVEECKGQTPNEGFCTDGVVRVCHDLVAFSDTVCMSGAACVETGPRAACACASGRADKAGTCLNVDECKRDNGGCDGLTTCSDTPGIVPICGQCPKGYAGDGAAGCKAALTALSLLAGELQPALKPEISKYSALVTLGTPTITLTPEAPAAIAIKVEGVPVKSGAAWTSRPLKIGANEIGVSVQRAGVAPRSYTLTLKRGEQEAYLKASNAAAGHGFGTSVSMWGDTLVVGAPHDSNDASGKPVPGSQALDESGAVHVFVRAADGGWSQQAYLKASNANTLDYFGSSVAIYGDTLIIGADGESSGTAGVHPAANPEDMNDAPGSGAVYVFERDADGGWQQKAYVKASNPGWFDHFGNSVSMWGDTFVVAAYAESSAAVGVDNASSSAGQADDSARYAGAAYVFVRDGQGSWSQQAYLKASNTTENDDFGMGVAIYGDSIVVGAPYEDGNGLDQADESFDAAGAAYVFVRDAGSWSQRAYLKASNLDAHDNFGWSVGIWGDTIAIGASYECSGVGGVDNAGNGSAQIDDSVDSAGAVYVFGPSSESWAERAYIKARYPKSFDRFGTSLSIRGDLIVVGGESESTGAAGVQDPKTDAAFDLEWANSGAAYVFERGAGGWTQRAWLKASDPVAYDALGISVAISGDNIVVGAPAEDSDARGTAREDLGAPKAADSGAVYVFR